MAEIISNYITRPEADYIPRERFHWLGELKRRRVRMARGDVGLNVGLVFGVNSWRRMHVKWYKM